MADLIKRALGRAALRRVEPREPEKPFARPGANDRPTVDMKPRYSEDMLNNAAEALRVYNQRNQELYEKTVEEDCLNDLAATIRLYYPGLVVDGERLRDRLGELVRTDNQLDRLRRKYGWHDCSKVLPNHSRHVLIWTNRGEYRAYYDHVHGCWRTTRDGLRITHWREQCGPEVWPRAE